MNNQHLLAEYIDIYLHSDWITREENYIQVVDTSPWLCWAQG